MRLIIETLNTPVSNWKIDVMEDVFPWDFYSVSFNYRKYFDLVTEHLVQGTAVDSALARTIYASLYCHLGQYSKNPEHLKQAVVLDTQFPVYQFCYAKGLIERGQPDDYTQAGTLLTQLAENSILFLEAFYLLKRLQEKQLYMCPKIKELAVRVFNYLLNCALRDSLINKNDFTAGFLGIYKTLAV
jgi:hypothetical protein